MKREFFMKTRRLGFSWWRAEDIDSATRLWGDARVTRYICASGVFSGQDVADRLCGEIERGEKHGIQYWPVFDLITGDIAGCCGLRPRNGQTLETGFHFRPEYWGMGYASEAARAVMAHAFMKLNAGALFAGHHPENLASRRLLLRLGFEYTGDELYPPTGLCHPSYEMSRERYLNMTRQ